MIVRIITFVIAVALLVGTFLCWFHMINTTTVKRLDRSPVPGVHSISKQSDAWNNRQDFSQKPTPWDLAVQQICADYGNKMHALRGGGAHPAFTKRWMKDIMDCQKKLGFMAKRLAV